MLGNIWVEFSNNLKLAWPLQWMLRTSILSEKTKGNLLSNLASGLEAGVFVQGWGLCSLLSLVIHHEV